MTPPSSDSSLVLLSLPQTWLWSLTSPVRTCPIPAAPQVQTGACQPCCCCQSEEVNPYNASPSGRASRLWYSFLLPSAPPQPYKEVGLSVPLQSRKAQESPASELACVPFCSYQFPNSGASGVHVRFSLGSVRLRAVVLHLGHTLELPAQLKGCLGITQTSEIVLSGGGALALARLPR